MNKIKIAVIGSCVSRDGFNSKFVHNYKEFYQCVLAQNHMSMISLVSNPIPFKPKKLGEDLTDFNKQILMTELTKSVWDSLKLTEPDYLILDFYPDVYFGVRQVGNSFITDKTWLFKNAPLYSTLDLKDRIKIENNYQQFMELWKRSVDIFMARMRNEFPYIKIIVNKIHFTDYYIQKDSDEVRKISKAGKYREIDVVQFNKWLDEFYQYFEDHYEVLFLEYEKEYLSDEEHIWEFFYVHYTKDFYIDFTTKLLSIILQDLYSYKLNDKKTTTIFKPNDNLIRNSTFNLGNAFWTSWQDDFRILQPEKDCPTSHILSIKKNGVETDIYRQVWSHGVEINAKGTQPYTISFDIRINDIKKVDSTKNVFALRTFNKIDKVLQKDSEWNKNIKLSDIKKLKDNQWIRCSYTFKPTKGKFLKIAPYLMRNGNISWRNIKLEKGGIATEWIPSYKEEGETINRTTIKVNKYKKVKLLIKKLKKNIKEFFLFNK